MAAFAFTALLVSCGGEKKEDKKEEIKIGAKKESTSTNDNEVTLALAGNDLMKYDKTEFTVEAGKEVTLNFRHTGKIEKKIMGHNFVLLKEGTDVGEFAREAAAAGESQDWIPEGDNIIAHTKMIGGGQSTSVTFMAPAAGTYDFICSFPGHSGLMKGKFIVK